MYNRVDVDMIIAREKRRYLLHQAEQDRLIRLVQARREPETKAGRRAWDRLKRWLCPMRLSRHTDRYFSIGAAEQRLLNAFYWAGKE